MAAVLDPVKDQLLSQVSALQVQLAALREKALLQGVDLDRDTIVTESGIEVKLAAMFYWTLIYHNHSLTRACLVWLHYVPCLTKLTQIPMEFLILKV